ncbi:MAG: hypothetical protein E7463_09620, partial [Ruminococcaceae bacterium]|nr:hypothetical protein [Oscillospiraceae bacterium]
EVTFTITKPAPAAFTITQQPQDRIANEGDTVTFSVTVAGGTAPYTYAWEGYNGRWPLIGSESTVTVTAGISQDAITKVRCIITDSNGNIVGSRTATLTVLEGLKCTGTSPNGQIKVGTTGTFTASFSGGKAPYTYKWVVDGSTKGLDALTATTSQSDLGNSSTVSIMPIAPKVYNSKEYFLMKCVCTDADGNKAESRVITVSAYN